MQLHYGVHPQLEDAATELIRKSLEGVTSMSEKSDILTPWKEVDRRRREVYTSEGVPDGAVRRGMYHRAWNSWHPKLNSREGKLPSGTLDDGFSGIRFAPDEDEGVFEGGVYNLMLVWGNQRRFKCPGCSRFFRAAEEFTCRCGIVLQQQGEEGHFKIAKIAWITTTRSL